MLTSINLILQLFHTQTVIQDKCGPFIKKESGNK